MSGSKKQHTNTDVSETLVKWAKTYFEENEEALKLFDIKCLDDLKMRFLE
jgi:hypothetical protein